MNNITKIWLPILL